MSTIKVDTYQTRGGASEIAIDKLKGVAAAGSMLVVGEGGTNTTNLQQGLAKAWISLNGTGTIAIRDSFNVSDITDTAVGLTDVEIGTNMASAEYSLSGASGTFIGNSDNVRLGFSTEAGAPTAGTYRTVTREANDDNNRDVTYSFAQVFGDLA